MTGRIIFNTAVEVNYMCLNLCACTKQIAKWFLIISFMGENKAFLVVLTLQSVDAVM